MGYPHNYGLKPSPCKRLPSRGSRGCADVAEAARPREGQMSICLQRREVIAALGGAAAWPLAARAQQGDRVRRIGVLIPSNESDSEGVVSAITQALGGLGWSVGRNVRIDWRWAGADRERARTYAAELV